MSPLFRRRRRAPRRSVVLATTVALLAALLTLVTVPSAAAAIPTVLFQNAFNDRTVDGIGTVTVPTPSSGTNIACLTASGNTSVLPLLSCSPAPDAQGSGVLRLTGIVTNQVGGIFGATSFPSSNGLDVTFNTYQYGGNGADGMGFVLAAVDPANPVPPAGIGPSGGSLGYTPSGSLNGLTTAYLGVGLDVFGNFSNSAGGFTGTGCGTVANITTAVPGAVVVRGPGNGKVGYCGLATTYDGTTASRVTLKSATRALSKVPGEVLINPTATAFTSASGISVSPGTYKVVVTPVGGAAKTLTGALPAVPSTLYPSTSWLNSNGVPKQLVFGFLGSTGGSNDAHEASDVKVLTFNPVPELAVSTTSYSAASTVAGGPVNYTAVASVLSGADENSAISVTQTLPTGAVPVGAFGSGWLCGAPSGQTISCTTTATSFPTGTVLPPINIIGIVTASSMSSAVVQNSSLTSVGSNDAKPGTDTVMSPGTVPAAPTATTVSPATGPIAGGGAVTVAVSTGTAPTAIEIGTAAEQAAGTPITLLPCVGAATTNCFTFSGGNVVIPSMPARSTAAPVTITVVTLGVATSVAYTYADKPATPAAPTATAGVLSDTVSWVAPTANGSPITGYLLTPYLNGVAQTPISYDASSTTRTLTGLTAGASYTYTVAAINGYGTSAASLKSAAVVPYTVPTAPTVTAVAAGDSAATITWSAPTSNGSSAITGYVVTPYIGTVAQAPQTFSSTALSQTVTGLTPGTAYTFTVSAINAAGTGPPSAKSTAVTPNVSPSITSTSPPPGEVGAAYSKQIVVTGGTGPYLWSVSNGTLPAGLTLNPSTGLLSGTPTAAGNFPVTLQVVDASNQSASVAVTLAVAPAPAVAFAPAAGEVGVAYSAQPTVTGGTGPFSWAVTGGSLPAGLTLNTTTGQISGTPTASGSVAVTVGVTDAFGQVAARTATIAIAALPTMTATPPAAGQVGLSYSSNAFAVTGGTAPITWSVSAGALPPGLSLAAGTGVLSGTPSTAGTYSFTVSAVDANGQATTKVVTLTVAAGPLVITKTANVSSAVAGGTVLYTITVANTSATAFPSVSLTDPLNGVLDDASYNANASATSGTVGYSAPTLSWTGAVAANATVTITYSVTVSNPDIGNKVLTNTVTSGTLGTNCAGSSTDTRCTATVTVAGLTIVKTADVASTTPGGVVRYSVVVTNSGQSAYAGAAFTDGLSGVLDDAAYNSDATATSGSVGYAGGAVSWTGNLAVGASATVTYSVTVANPDTGDRSLTGTVVSSSAGSSCPGGNAAASCSAVVPVLVPALVISNTASVSSTTPGSVVTYTLTVSNTGQTPYTGTAVTVALAGALDDAAFNSDAVASAGGTAYSAGTLTWTGNLAVGAVVTVTYSLTVANPDAGDKVLTTVSRSSAAGNTCPAGSTNAACTATVAVLVPSLAITKSADVASTTPGSVVRYTISATNNGQTAYNGATFSDPLGAVLDDAVYNTNATASAGSVSYAGQTLAWTGNLAIGATATITYSVTVNSPDSGDKVLANTVTSTTAGSNCAAASTDPRCTSRVPVLIPAVTITTAVDNQSPSPGSVVRYTVTLDNTGQTSYSGAIATLNFAGVLDDAAYNADAVTSTGSLVANAGGTYSWTYSLAPGGSATATLSFTVNNPDTGDRALKSSTVSDAAGSTCPTGTSAAACSTAVAVLVPGLLITKTADVSTVVTGGTVTYTVTVVNTGQTSYPAATFTDSLAQVLTDATYGGGATATVGTVSYAAPTLTWTGALAPGARAVVTFAVMVRDPDPGDKRMTNTVTSSSAGSNCATGSVDSRCTASVDVLVPALTIASSASVATAAPGTVVRFTVTVTNTGQTPYSAATVTESLATVTDDADYNGDVAATTGSATVASGALSWTGALAVGAGVTITYSATVHTAAGGDDVLVNTVVSGSSGSNCASGSTDVRCAVAVAVSRLVISRNWNRPSATPGSTVVATTTFTNTGKVPYTGINIALDRTNLLDDVTATGDQRASAGTLVVSGATLSWSGSIAVGATVTVTASYVVDDPDTGDRRLGGFWSSTAPGNNCPAGSADIRCTNPIPVLVPALTIVTSANTTAVVPGGTLSFTTTLTNTGQTPYTGAVVGTSLAGALDDGTFDPATAAASSGTLSYSSPTLTWTGDLAVGATVTITYAVVTAAPDPGDKTVVTRVSSTVPGSSCPPASGSASCRSTVVVLTPALTIVKTANLTAANLGAVVTYTVTVTNSGQTPYPAATFTDALAGVTDDATFDPAAATASVGTVNYVSGTLSWMGPLPVGQVATITYPVTVANPDAGDLSLRNTVVSTSTGSNCAAGSTDTRCTALVPVLESTALTLTKTADVSTTVAGAVVHYTAILTNSSTVGVPSATFTDALADVLDDAVDNGDAAATGGTVTSRGTDLVWTGPVAAGATVTVTYSVTVRKPLAGNNLLTDTLTSASVPGSNNCATGSGDRRCTTVVPVAALDLRQIAAETTTTPGAVVHVTAVYTNTGQVPYTGITVSSPRADTSDDTIPTGDQVASSGVLVRTSTSLVWTGDIPVGGLVTITRTLTVQNPDPGNQRITATLSSTAVGSNCGPGSTDPACTFLVTVLTPALSITTAADAATTVPGATVGYTVTVRNTGQTAYTGATFTADLTGVLTDARFDANAGASAGTVAYSSPKLTWTGDLAVGATATITYSVTVLNPDPGDKAMVTVVSSTTTGSTCPPASGNAGCTNTVVVLTPALTIVTSASVLSATLGSAVTYTVTITNTGQTPFAAATFTDSLAGVLDDGAYVAASTTTSSGATTYSGGVLSWTGALAVGAFATVTYTVTTNSPSTGDRALVSTVVSNSAGSNCATGSADTRCSTTVPVVNAVTLTITKTAGVTSTLSGEVVRYTVAVVNSSSQPIVGADFTDPLGDIVDDASYNADASATGGTVTVNSSSLFWTGTVAANATVTVTYSVTVGASRTGNQVLAGTVTSGTSQVSNDCLVRAPGPACISIVPIARLLIQQGYTESTTTPGAVVHLSATFTNTGAFPYQGISITSPIADSVDDAIPGGDQSATSGTLVLTSSAIVWTGDIPVGATVTITGTLTVKNPDPGNRVVSGTLVSSAPGNNCTSGGIDPRCTATSTVLLPGLTITKSVDRTTATPGDVVRYSVEVRNSGQTAYTGAVVTDSLTGVLDDATYAGDAAATSGAVSFANGILTYQGDLAVGAVATISYSVTVRSPDPGDKSLVDSAVSTAAGSSCPPASGAAACRSSVDVLTPGLTIVKTADTTTANLGTTVTYTVSVTNSGQTSYAPATFTDALAGVTDDATFDASSATATAGAVTTTGDTLSWSGPLAPGQSSIITYAVTVASPDTGDRVLGNTVVSGSTGSNCAAGSSDLRCSATVTVTNSLALTFTSAADVASTVAGGTVRYTVTVANTSGRTVPGVTFTDSLAGVLDDAVYNGDLAADTGAPAYSGGTISWTGTVPAGGTAIVSFSVTVASPRVGDDLLTDRLVSTTPSVSNNCLAGSGDGRCSRTVAVAGLVLEQHYTEASTTPGSPIHLTSTFVNTGQVPYIGISVSSPSADVVDDAVPNGAQSATSGSLMLSSTAIMWTGDIPVGGSVTVTGTLTVDDPDIGNRIIRGTLMSSAAGGNCPTGGTDPRCTAALRVLIPALTISTAANVASVVPGGTAAYTLTIANTGETPYTGITVHDSLAGLLDDATYLGNAVSTSGTVTYTRPDLAWTGDLAVGATVTVSFSATALRPATGDKSMTTIAQSTAVGSSCTPADGDSACTATVAVLTPALSIVATTDSATAAPGTRVSYTTVVTNTGQTNYGAAAFRVALAGTTDDATYDGDAVATTGTVGVANGVLSWSSPLAIGASATVTYSVTVNNPVTGDFRLVQTATSANQGSTCPAGGTDPRCSTSVPIAGLRLTTVTDRSTAQPTSVVSSTSTFTNTGQVPYFGIVVTIDVTGTVDDATYNGDGTTSAGQISGTPDSPVLTWTGDLAVGASVVIGSSFTVNNPDTGDKVLTTVVSTDAPAGNCPTGATTPAAACVSRVTVLTPGLTISKSASTTTATPGSSVDYTITAVNTGETDYPAAVITDSLAGIRGDAVLAGAATATRGAVRFADPTLTWTGPLSVGQTVVISYTVVINDPDLGDKLLVNRVVSDEIGSTCPTGGTAAGCSASVTVTVPALDISLTSDTNTTTPGSTVGYTVTIRNTGQTAYNGAAVAAHLTGVLDDAAYRGGATTTVGSVAFTAPDLLWTGSLAIGATAVVSYAVVVADPDLGDRLLTTTISSAAPGSTCTDGAPCSNAVRVLIPGLAVSTSASAATVTPGDRVVFTTVLRNTGETPYVDARFSSSLAGVVDDATISAVGSTVGVATYTAPGLTWIGSLPIGGAATITYTATVRSPDPGDRTMAPVVVSPETGSTCQAGSENPHCVAAVTVLVPALSVSTSSTDAATTPGSVVTFTVQIRNTGQTPYTSAVVTDSLQGLLTDAIYNADAAVVGGGTVGYDAGTLRWTGDLPVAASATITFSVTVADPDTGDKLLVNAVSSAVPGSTCPPGVLGAGCSATVQVLVPGLTVTKAADVSTVTAGNVVRYTIIATNTGQTDYRPATLTDALGAVLDDARWNGDAVASSGAVSFANNTLAWTGSIAIGDTVTVSYSVTTLYPADGDHLLANAVTSPSPGSTCRTSAPAACRTSVRELVPALTIAKSADTAGIAAGGTVHYTITATNNGEADYPVAVLTDSLADVLDDAVYDGDAAVTATADAGTLEVRNGTLTWSGSIPRQAMVMITYSVTTQVADTGDAVLANRVTSTATGSNCPVQGGDPRCGASTAVAARFIALSGVSNSFKLTGLPDTTVTGNGVVTMKVTTNDVSGYTVTVEPAVGELVGQRPGNTDTIPIDRLSVRASGTSAFQSLLPGSAIVVHQQGGPSGAGGDVITNDFQVRIPFVNNDTYSGTLEYIATAQ